MAFLPPSREYSRLSTHQIGSTAEKRQGFESILGAEKAKQLEQLVEERSLARLEGNYLHADMIRDQISSLDLPDNWEVVVTDVPRKQGGGSTWELVQTKQEMPILEGPTVLQLAHAALGLAVECSVQANLGRAHTALGMQQQTSHKENEGNEQLDFIVEQAKARFQHTNWTDAELAGRKAADAAFWFALAGVTDQFIFENLTDVATRELGRFGSRSSCRAKDIYQIMERFSAAGFQNTDRLEEAAKKALIAKGDTDDCDPLLDFHSDRSLLLIWKFSTKQKKQRAFLRSALTHWQRQKGDGEEEESGDSELTKTDDMDIGEAQIQEYNWNGMFKDPSRPLVIDVGCGMGVSLLGLASGNSQVSSQVLLGENSSSLSWKDCNFVGLDLGALGIGYARGLAFRRGIDDRLQFVVDSAESCLQSLVRSYPGPIKLCLIQFPTPYSLKTTPGTGNTQLPSSPRDGFMVTEELLHLVHQALSKSDGKLLLQSNCEDVAVYMHDLAIEKVGFQVEAADQSMSETTCASYGYTSSTPRVPQRMADWITMGGKRAVGDDWSKAPILHRASATETEVACALNGTPVHRCVLRAVGDQI
ncbi:unnamed protein product [Cylindrotheca closterium]|uniref:tRNA (guanine(46)-N(7))-methyltransferase n=1 Tax=Cylindrotheca closterium TaxID=2856 RepID=A0AAD2FSW8_9STRA|nr:unnamed protein product [Cylindrotheca closterium]